MLILGILIGIIAVLAGLVAVACIPVKPAKPAAADAVAEPAAQARWQATGKDRWLVTRMEYHELPEWELRDWVVREYREYTEWERNLAGGQCICVHWYGGETGLAFVDGPWARHYFEGWFPETKQ